LNSNWFFEVQDIHVDVIKYHDDFNEKSCAFCSILYQILHIFLCILIRELEWNVKCHVVYRFITIYELLSISIISPTCSFCVNITWFKMYGKDQNTSSALVQQHALESLLVSQGVQTVHVCLDTLDHFNKVTHNGWITGWRWNGNAMHISHLWLKMSNT
jgi:hypothetical protein